MSQQRRCDIYLASDGNWYMTLGDFEYAEDDHDCTDHGPFSTKEALEQYLRNGFSNPGCSCEDASGQQEPPEKPIKIRRGYSLRPINFF